MVALTIALMMPLPRWMPSRGSNQLPIKAPRIPMIRSPTIPNPGLSHGLFEGQNPVDGLIINVVGDADLRLLVVAAFVVITPADKPNAARRACRNVPSIRSDLVKALCPIVAASGEDLHLSVGKVNLDSVAVEFHLMYPTRALGRLLN